MTGIHFCQKRCKNKKVQISEGKHLQLLILHFSHNIITIDRSFTNHHQRPVDRIIDIQGSPMPERNKRMSDPTAMPKQHKLVKKVNAGYDSRLHNTPPKSTKARSQGPFCKKPKTTNPASKFPRPYSYRANTARARQTSPVHGGPTMQPTAHPQNSLDLQPKDPVQHKGNPKSRQL